MKSCSSFCLVGIFTAIIFTTNGKTFIEHMENGKPIPHTSKTVVPFEMKPADIKGQKCKESSVFKLEDITWKIKACRTERSRKSDKKYVEMWLVSVFSGKTALWSCRARATFELLGAKSDAHTISESIDYFDFSSDSNQTGIKKFIEWPRFKSDIYTKDDEVAFKVEVEAEKPNQSPSLYQTSSKYHMRVRRVSLLGEQYSNEIVAGGIRWRTLVNKISYQSGDCLAVFVYQNGDDIDMGFTRNVTATFQLVSFGDTQPKPKQFNKEFAWRRSNWGFTCFMKWSDLVDGKNKYVEDDALILDIEIAVSQPTKVT